MKCKHRHTDRKTDRQTLHTHTHTDIYIYIHEHEILCSHTQNADILPDFLL